VRGSSARAVPERGRPKAQAVKGRHLSLPHARNRCARGKCPCIARFAEVVGTSLRSQKRATGTERVESPRGPHGARERGLSHRHVPSARAQRLAPGERGRFGGARRSSSRERRVFTEDIVGSSALRCGRVARWIQRWKAPRIGKAHAFHKAPAEPVLAASESRRGTRQKRPHTNERGGGDRGVRDDLSRSRTGEENALA